MRAFIIFLFSLSAFAQNNSFVSQTQNRRQGQRLSIYDWIMQNKQAIAAQNSRYGSGGGSSGPYPDLVLQYRADRSRVTRDGIELGDDERTTAKMQFLLDDLFRGGNHSFLLNVDLGVEGFYSKTSNFKALAESTQVAHSYTETGGGLLLRPFGRSSQDTGLLVKGGYINVDYIGLWENSETPKKVWNYYLGAEAKVYLLPFLGVLGDYMTVPENEIEGIGGRWSMYRFLYGAYIEVLLLNLQVYIVDTEYSFTSTATQTKVKEFSKGVGFAATLHF